MKRWSIHALLFLSLWALGTVRHAGAQVYGYTDERGVLVLSNVPTDPRMRVVAEESSRAVGRIHRYSGQYDPLILKAATLSGLDTALVTAVIAVESGFNRFARSHKGAQGLMQLMPDTARRYGVGNPYDAWQNLRGGSQHLRDLLDEFDDLRLALAAYNAGATPVRRLRDVPPYRETQNYVRKVMALYRSSSRISITKGSRTYRLTADGRTIIKEAGRKQSQVAQSQVAVGSSPGPVGAVSSAPESSEKAPPLVLAAGGSFAAPETAVATDPVEPVFFRYTDAAGVIYITRDKPLHENYEVLTP